MLCLPEQRALVYHLKQPSRILDVIPSATKCLVEGQELVVVPHRQDETRVLRNLGFKAPAPILSYYNWPGRWTPMEHQRLTSAFCTMHQRAFVLNDMGTMKTASVIWAALWLMRTKKIRRVLITAPLSTLSAVWQEELFRLAPNASVAVLHGSAKKRIELAHEPHDFYIVNHHGLKIVQEHLHPEIDLIIGDEATVYKNSGSTLWKTMNAVCKEPNRWVWLLTGTPMANSPLDAWALARLVNPAAVPRHFKSWRDMTMKQMATFKWVPKPEATELVANALQPAIRFKRDDCIELPETFYVKREVPLEELQKKVYEQLKKEMAAEVNTTSIVAANEGIQAMKLVQVCCGVVYDSEHTHHVVGAKPRIEALKELIEEAPAKVIVFIPLTGALEYVKSELESDHSVAVVDGSVSKNARDEIFRSFQHDTTPRVLLAHPQTMSHGLTLTEAATIIWYAPIHSNETYEQANARITRPGQRRMTTIVNISSTPLETRMYSRLQERRTMQGLLLEMFGSQEN